MSTSPDDIFSDTNVLFDFTFNRDDGEADDLLHVHPTENVISESVRQEYKSVKEDRVRVLKSILKAANNGGLDSWNPPQSLNMKPSTRQYCQELFQQLLDLGNEKAIKTKLKQEVQIANAGWDHFFGQSSEVIDVIWSGSRDPMLSGYLRSCIDNQDDVKIICDAADWASDSGSGYLASSDETDILSNEEEISRHTQNSREGGEVKAIEPGEFLSRF